jgi:hypothetical protein
LGRGGSRGDFGTEGGAEVGRSGRTTAVDSGSADGAVSCGAAAPADLAIRVRGGAFPPNRNAVSLRSGSAWQVPRPVVSDWSAMGCDRCASRSMTERAGGRFPAFWTSLHLGRVLRLEEKQGTDAASVPGLSKRRTGAGTCRDYGRPTTEIPVGAGRCARRGFGPCLGAWKRTRGRRESRSGGRCRGGFVKGQDLTSSARPFSWHAGLHRAWVGSWGSGMSARPVTPRIGSSRRSVRVLRWR